MPRADERDAPREPAWRTAARRVSARRSAPQAAGGRSKRGPLTMAVLAACLLLAALLGLFLPGAKEDAPADGRPPAALALANGPKSYRVGVRKIQDIGPGQKVLADVPVGAVIELGAADSFEIDPPTWRLLRLRTPKVDGSWVSVWLLRSLAWIEDEEAEVGGTVEIAVPECGIEGEAEVLAIDACPPIPPGPGRVVTGVFRHESAAIVDVAVEGLAEPIGTTANHPFWSEDRQEFVRADALKPGERLRTQAGRPRVVSVASRGTPAAVYNLEVQFAHVYHVTSAGVLVHNGTACGMLENAKAGRAREAYVQGKLDSHFTNATVQRELYLRNAEGKIAKDIAGKGRRIDHAVIENGEVRYLVETTSKSATKATQIAKEMNIRQNGGTFIRDRVTKKLLDVSNVPTRIIRVE